MNKSRKLKMSSSSAEVLKPCSETCGASNTSPLPELVVATTKPAAWGGAGIASQGSVVSCPWGAASPTSPEKDVSTSFRDLMSEDLANDIQDKENELYLNGLIAKGETDSSNLLEFKRTEDTSDDLLLAQMLQYQFDREYDQQVNREEKQYNGNSKVSVSFDKFKICPTWYGPDSDDDLPEVDEENRALDSFEARERGDPLMPSCGYVKVGKGFVTKHDLGISGRKNAERIMNLPPGINTGDGGGFDMHLSNKVFNNLQHSAKSEVRRKNRVHDKVEKATSEMALDPNTRLLIFKLVNNAVLECVNGVISSGKEAVVFHAQGGYYEDQPLPEECAVKVFKTTLTDFKTRERYIREDYRFKDRMSKNNTQKTIRSWAEKEYHNLRRLQRAGIPSPKPILIKKHVLLMSFIGNNHQAAPKLKEAKLSFANLCVAYEEVVSAMVKMFQGCHLVHADMSEYNVLWHEDTCWIIDVGQAVEPTHPHALMFLFRDCTNIIKFFTSKGLSDIMTPLQLFEKVSNIKLPGPEEAAAAMIEEYESNQELWRHGMKNISDQFEHLWQEIQADEKQQKHKYKDEEVEEDSDEENDNLQEEKMDLMREETHGTPAELKNAKSTIKKKQSNKGRSTGDGGGSACIDDDINKEEKDYYVMAEENREYQKSRTVKFTEVHNSSKNDIKQGKKSKNKKK